jgi:hypothetical protein
MLATRQACTAALLAVALALPALAGCDGPDATRSEPAGQGAGAHTDWSEPGHYAYTLLSTCGERGGLGLFRLWVRNGRVERAKPLREGSDVMPLRQMPTIGDIVGIAAQAQNDGADQVRVTRAADGRPRWVSIDYMTNAIDDEACFRVSDLLVLTS